MKKFFIRLFAVLIAIGVVTAYYKVAEWETAYNREKYDGWEIHDATITYMNDNYDSDQHYDDIDIVYELEFGDRALTGSFNYSDPTLRKGDVIQIRVNPATLKREPVLLTPTEIDWSKHVIFPSIITVIVIFLFLFILVGVLHKDGYRIGG